MLARCRALGRVYGTGPGRTVALHDVECEVQAGASIAICGPSGSGKSTLLHLLAGLDEPTSGSLTWPGIGARAELRPGPVAVIFQGPSLLAPLTVRENVALPLLLAGLPARDALPAADGALERLGLAGLAGKLPDEISGGQAQRVAIARALAGRSSLILADEPTSQLDRASGAQVVEVLLEVARQSGAALVVATHDHAISSRLEQCWDVADGAVSTGAEVARC